MRILWKLLPELSYRLVDLLWCIGLNDVVVWNVTAEVRCGPAEERLINEIFKVRRYQKLARPVRRESEAVDVVFGLSLQQIIAVVS